MPFFQHNNISFNYLDQGSGQPILFLHGMGGDSRQALQMLGVTKNIRLLSFDFRGHGESKCSNTTHDFSMEQYVEDTLAFLDYLHVSSCVVVGVSLGSAIALKMTLQAPNRVQKAIFIRPAWLNEKLPLNLEVSPTISEMIEKNGAEAAGKLFQERSDFQQLKIENSNCAQSVLWHFERPQASESFLLLRLLTKEIPFQKFEELKKMEQDCLILICQEDPIHPYEYGVKLKEHISTAKLLEVAPRYLLPDRYLEESRLAIERFIES